MEKWEAICNMVIRPPRLIYELNDLGPRQFSIGGKQVQRTDFELINPRGLTVQCSHFEPLEDWGKPLPCVVYCHGNGGGRLDALDSVRVLLPCDISVMAVDFAGSGLSGGDYVSLGYFEKDDLATAVQYLRNTGRVTTIGLWGRSMGAVTSMMYAREDPSIAGMVLDSPFCSLQKIAEELVLGIATLQKVPRITRMAVSIALRAMRASIKKRAHFDIRSLETLDVAPHCFIPALFVHGQYDGFVRPHHSEMLYERYGGDDKNRILVEGDHNSLRPQFFMDSAVIFFMNTLYGDGYRVPPKTDSSSLGSALPSHHPFEPIPIIESVVDIDGIPIDYLLDDSSDEYQLENSSKN